jgi:hypothetical protein
LADPVIPELTGQEKGHSPSIDGSPRKSIVAIAHRLRYEKRRNPEFFKLGPVAETGKSVRDLRDKSFNPQPTAQERWRSAIVLVDCRKRHQPR